MKLPIRLSVFVLVTFSIFWRAVGQQVIIDTKFDQIEGDHKLRVIPETAEEPQIPVSLPNHVTARGTASIIGSTEAGVGIKSPFALLKGTDDPKTGSEIYWDLRGLRLKSGKFALSWQLTPQDTDADGVTLQVVPSGEDGSWIWPQKRPLCIACKQNAIVTDEPESEKIPYGAGVTSTLRIEFDMDAMTWSASVDGKPLLKTTSFKQILDPGKGMMLGGIFLRDSWKNVAVSNLKFEKLEGNSAPIPERAAMEKIPRIAWVGDSITRGYGLANSEKTSPPGVLRSMLDGKAMVGNFGISGTTLLKKGDNPYWKQAALARAKQFAPSEVIIMLGSNDSKPQNWAHSSEIAGDMAALVTEFKNLPSKPEVIVVLSIPVYKPAFGITEDLLAQVRPLVAQGAKQAGATVVESAGFFPDDKAGLYSADGVHPNEKGAELIAELVAKNLPGP